MPTFTRSRSAARPYVLAAMMTSLLAAAAAAPVTAQVSATGDYLRRMDGNADGRVSLVEYQDWMGYAFARMDLDGDGQLVASELPGGRGRTVSLATHRSALAAAFARQDANGDGSLSAIELAAPPR